MGPIKDKTETTILWILLEALVVKNTSALIVLSGVSSYKPNKLNLITNSESDKVESQNYQDVKSSVPNHSTMGRWTQFACFTVLTFAMCLSLLVSVFRITHKLYMWVSVTVNDELECSLKFGYCLSCIKRLKTQML